MHIKLFHQILIEVLKLIVNEKFDLHANITHICSELYE